MSATLEKTTSDAESATEHYALPDASALEDKTPEWCRMSAGQTGFLLGLGLILVVLFANRPLWHSDLWDHVNYGQYILSTGSVPHTEPLLPLAEGMPMVPSEWLSQVVMAQTLNVPKLGLPALQFGHGFLVVVSLAAVGFAITRKSHSVLFGIFGYFVFLAINWHQFLIIRPQSVGIAFYSILLAVLTTSAIRRKAVWMALPLMFVVWANAHGSFAVGLAIMALFGVGRFLDTLVRTRSLKLACANPGAINLLLLTQLCGVAAILNPAGLEIYAEVLRVGSHPNISSMFEWAPMTLRMRQGQATAIACVLLLLVLRISPRRLRFEELAALIVTGTLALWSSRMVNWFAPVIAISLGVHGAAAWITLRHSKLSVMPAKRSGLWTVVSLGLCWIFFGFTALGTQTIHGKTADEKRSLSRATPVETARFLASAPQLPPGIAFAPAEWAGYLTNAGSPKFVPMVNLHVHVISPEIWSDYLRLLGGTPDWSGLLDRYGINLVILDKKRQALLASELGASLDYERLYEDAQAVIFERKETVK